MITITVQEMNFILFVISSFLLLLVILYLFNKASYKYNTIKHQKALSKKKKDNAFFDKIESFRF